MHRVQRHPEQLYQFALQFVKLVLFARQRLVSSSVVP